MRIATWVATWALLVGLMPGACQANIIIGQVDDFQDGTTQGWGSGLPNPNPPVNVPSGGPAGAGDAYLLITSTGGVGPGSRLAAFNTAQWSGDYLAAGVAEIAADLNNLGTSALEVRLFLGDPLLPGGFSMSLDSVSLPVASGWQSVTFPLGPGDLTGGLDLDALLGNVPQLRIFHNPDPFFPPPAVLAELGVDNVTAVRVLTSVATGNWNAATTWNDGTLIPTEDDKTIVGGHTVTVATGGAAGSLLINDGGKVMIDAGNTLAVVGGVEVAAGTLEIASTGLLDLGGDLTMRDGSTYGTEIGDIDAGSLDNGLVSVAGDVELDEGSALSVQAGGRLADPGGGPIHGDITRTIITADGAGGVVGGFTDVPDVGDFSLPAGDPDRYGAYLGHGVWFGNDKTGQGAIYVEDRGLVTAVDVAVFQAIGGDANGDRTVSFADFNDLANNYTGSLPSGIGDKEWRQGDFDGDKDVDFSDFNNLANNYTGTGVEYGPAKDALRRGTDPELVVYPVDAGEANGTFGGNGGYIVPEPGTLVLFGSGLIGLLLWWRRKRPD